MTDFQIALLESLEKQQAFSEGSAVLFGSIKDEAKLPVSLAELTGCRNAKLIETVTKRDLKHYFLSKKGIKFLNETAQKPAEPDPEEAPVIDQAVTDNVESFNALAEVKAAQMPNKGTNYQADLSRENASLRQVIDSLEQQKDKLLADFNRAHDEAQKHETTSLEIHKLLTEHGVPENGLIARVKGLLKTHASMVDELNKVLEAYKAQSIIGKNLEQNARELNARIAALESHQNLISEEGLIEQVADLTMKLEEVSGAYVHYSVEYGGTLLTFSTQPEAIDAAHKVAAENIESAHVCKVLIVNLGTAKPVQSTVWESF